MKQPVWFIALSIGVTAVFYVLAYYLLPPPPPSGALVALFAGVALVLVWAGSAGVRRLRKKDGKTVVVWFVAAVAIAALAGCSSAKRSSTAPDTSPAPDTTAPAQASSTAPTPTPTPTPAAPEPEVPAEGPRHITAIHQDPLTSHGVFERRRE